MAGVPHAWSVESPTQAVCDMSGDVQRVLVKSEKDEGAWLFLDAATGEIEESFKAASLEEAIVKEADAFRRLEYRMLIDGAAATAPLQ